MIMYKKFAIALISIFLIPFSTIAASDGNLLFSEKEKPKNIKEH